MHGGWEDQLAISGGPAVDLGHYAIGLGNSLEIRQPGWHGLDEELRFLWIQLLGGGLQGCTGWILRGILLEWNGCIYRWENGWIRNGYRADPRYGGR